MNDQLPGADLPRVSSRSCYRLDPTQDSRWARFVERDPNAAVFHTVGWLNALRRTYGYEPVVYTTSPPTSELQNGLIFCRVESWFTGNRLVSLPFADHCAPLGGSPDDLNFLVRYLRTAAARQNWRYVEMRPTKGIFGQTEGGNGFFPAATYLLYVLDLRPDLDQLFRGFDRDSVQRRILRAERAGLTEKSGNSEDLLEQFYHLLLATRRRHALLPPPLAWFRNLVNCLGHAAEIRLAYLGNTAVSAVLTLRHRDTVYCKYGCSPTRFKRFAGVPWLLWRAIAASKATGATEFDMGHSEVDDAGLVRFKSHWVPNPQGLVYWRFPEASSARVSRRWKTTMKQVVSSMPDWSQALAGKLIYRHIT